MPSYETPNPRCQRDQRRRPHGPVASIDADPAKAMTSWRVATTWQGQTRSRADVTGFGFGGEARRAPLLDRCGRALELGGSNRFANPQEYLLAALNACIMVGYVAQCAMRGINLENLEIETEGDIDLRGFLGLNSDIAAGYEALRYTVRIRGDGSREQFEEVHAAVMATSPNFYNLSRPVTLKPTLVVE